MVKSISSPASSAASAAVVGNKRRLSTTGSRGVTSLTPEQLTKKRANDREAQRAIRERTKNQIESLERRVRELTSQQPYQELQVVLRQKEALQIENDEIRRRLESALAILQPILNAESTNGEITLLFTTCYDYLRSIKLIEIHAGSLSYQHGIQSHLPSMPSSAKPPHLRQNYYSPCIGPSTSVATSSVATASPTPSPNTAPTVPSWHGSGLSAPGDARTWSPVNALNEQRDTLAHGLDLGSSGERLGLRFLVDKQQNMTKTRNSSSIYGASAEGTCIILSSYRREI